MNDEPTTLTQRAAKAALDAATATLEAGGAKVGQVLVCVRADDVPAGEHPSAVDVIGFNDVYGVISTLLTFAQDVAKTGGVEITMMEVHHFDAAPKPSPE